MKYIDLHCDALTKRGGVFHVTAEGLRAGGCAIQCFAAFLPHPRHGYGDACALADKFYAMCEEEGYRPLTSMQNYKDGGINAVFTVEGGGAAEGSLANIGALYARGARIFAPLWNDENAFGYPNLVCPSQRKKRETRGLKPFGREAVELMFGLGMAVDVSHASDGVFWDVAAMSRARGIPFVASHSDAQAVYDDCRNLTDAQIRAIADCSGVVGLNFYDGFLSADCTEQGQRTALLAHAGHILNTGGEDVLALGSDFDGIPQNPYLPAAADVERLLGDFAAAFGSRITEKVAFGNAFRTLGAIF